MAPMWAKLREGLILEDPVPLHENVYLGCGQSEVPLPVDMIERVNKRQKQEHIGPARCAEWA